MFNPFKSNPFQRNYSVRELNLFRFLGKNALFASLTKEEKYLFLPYLHVRVYKRNEAVFFRNDPSQALYIVKVGRVAIFLDVEDKTEQLQQVRVSESFGENALLAGTRRMYNAVVSSEACELYVIPQVSLLEILDKHPTVRARVMTALAEQYNRNNENLFRAYQTSFGLFDLAQAYQAEEENQG